MITLGNFRAGLFPVFRMAKFSAVGFEVIFERQVYEVIIRKTGKKPVIIRSRNSVKKKRGVDPTLVNTSVCKLCGEMMIAGLCIGLSCPNSQLKKN